MFIKMKIVITIVTLSLLIIFSCEDDPVKPENHHPIIKSLTAFPDVVNPNDSLIVICNASDSDGDTLVYDWITTGVVRIKGARGDDHFLYHTYENSRIFYAPDSQFVLAPQDTFWVQCFVRDVKGGQAGALVTFIVKQDWSINEF